MLDSSAIVWGLISFALLGATTNICIPSMIYGAIFGKPKRAGESSPQV